MGKVSKRVRANLELIGHDNVLPLSEALVAMKKTQPVKFDETIELAVRLGIDVKKSDQMVRGAVSLPRGIGRELTVIAFAKGDMVDQAKEAGASEVGAEELAKKIQGGWMDFDVVIAAPDMMSVVGRLGRVLGPQGKMPSPKSGTVTPNVAAAVREFKAGKVTVRADAGGIVHAPVGKRSFEDDAIVENINALMAYIRSLKPAAAKGVYVLTTYMSTTMGPGIKVAGI